MIEISTARLTIRPFRLDDAEFVLRLLNEPEFIGNIGDKGVRNLGDAENYLRDGPMASYEQFGFGLWRVGLRVDDMPVGMAGLLRRDYLDDADIGYALLREFFGAGYAFEAASAVMCHAREQLEKRRVLAIVNEDNEPSIRLLRRLGFEANGTARVPGDNREVPLYEWT